MVSFGLMDYSSSQIGKKIGMKDKTKSNNEKKVYAFVIYSVNIIQQRVGGLKRKPELLIMRDVIW